MSQFMATMHLSFLYRFLLKIFQIISWQIIFFFAVTVTRCNLRGEVFLCHLSTLCKHKKHLCFIRSLIDCKHFPDTKIIKKSFRLNWQKMLQSQKSVIDRSLFRFITPTIIICSDTKSHASWCESGGCSQHNIRDHMIRNMQKQKIFPHICSIYHIRNTNNRKRCWWLIVPRFHKIIIKP